MTKTSWIVVLVGTLIGSCVASGNAAVGEEKPNALPAESEAISSLFLRRLEPKIYEERAAAFRRDSDNEAEPPDTARPLIGRRVAGVFPDGPAFGLGIVPGDVLVRLDERLLNGPRLGLTGNAQQLEYYSLETKELRTVRVESPRLGVQLVPYWVPEASLLPDKNQDKAWSRDVRIGILSWRKDLDLAETAWFLAIEAGFPPDAVCRQIGAEIATVRNRPDAAHAALKPLIQESLARQEAVPPSINLPLLYRGALGAGDLDTALSLVRGFPATFDDDHLESLETLKRTAEHHGFQNGRGNPPSRAAGAMLRIDRVPQLRGSDYYGIQEYAPVLRRREELAIQAATAHQATVAVQPEEPLPAFELSLTFSAESVDNTLDTYNKMVMLRVIQMRTPEERRAEPGPPDRVLLMVGLDQWGLLSCESGQGLDRPLSLPDLSISEFEKVRHTFGVARVGGVAEVSFNGHRVQLLPIEPAASIRFEVTVVGVNAKIHRLSLDELLERTSPIP